MGLGFAVLAAAATRRPRAARSTTSPQVGPASGPSRRAAVFYVDTLEHLRRGGRIGAAAALLGSALAVKPLLHLVDGHIEPLEKVRTSAKAIARLEELAVERRRRAARWTWRCTTWRTRTAPTALAERLRDRLPGSATCYVSEVGAVVGAHVGPGMLRRGRRAAVAGGA